LSGILVGCNLGGKKRLRLFWFTLHGDFEGAGKSHYMEHFGKGMKVSDILAYIVE